MTERPTLPDKGVVGSRGSAPSAVETENVNPFEEKDPTVVEKIQDHRHVVVEV